MQKKSEHSVEKNQIWLCKRSYTDYQENLIESDHEFYVLISSPVEKLNNEKLVRVMPISSKIELKSNEDILISDNTIVGYPFIIEPWNEQPILIDLLDQLKGNLSDNLVIIQEADSFTEMQLDFRRKEIINSSYLRQSVLSFLEWDEARTKKFVIVSFTKLVVAASLIGLILLIWQPFRLSPKKVFKEYNIAYENNIKTFYGVDEILRGNDCILPNFSVYECEIIQSALKRYDEKDYANSSKLLSSIIDLKLRDHMIFLYLSLSLLNDDKVLTAIDNFNYLSEFKSESFYEDLQYYRALAYIKNEQIIKARNILRSISKEGGKYSRSAEDLLKKLRWF